MGRGYEEAPWVFKGRALYQLQLVRLEEARKYIPEDLNIVSFCGYTLGGFYLAKYDESPVGAFEECVALAGIVWNKPTSCAWAARVYVNNRKARDHGRQHVGLPSRVCTFARKGEGTADQSPSWWDQPLSRKQKRSTAFSPGVAQPADALKQEAEVVMHNAESKPSRWLWGRSGIDEGLTKPVCSFRGFPSGHGRAGPRVNLGLPSYSGCTSDCPEMLQYACRLRTNVRLVPPLIVSCGEDGRAHGSRSIEDMSGILGGRPVLALAFDNTEMTVQKPTHVRAAQTVSGKDSWSLNSTEAVPCIVST